SASEDQIADLKAQVDKRRTKEKRDAKSIRGDRRSAPSVLVFAAILERFGGLRRFDRHPPLCVRHECPKREASRELADGSLRSFHLLLGFHRGELGALRLSGPNDRVRPFRSPRRGFWRGRGGTERVDTDLIPGMAIREQSRASQVPPPRFAPGGGLDRRICESPCSVRRITGGPPKNRSEEHTSELQSR